MMLLPEIGLDPLVEELRELARADRKAILARLTSAERRRVRMLLSRRPAAPAEPVSPYAPDIATRIAAADERLTPAGRKVLDAFLHPGDGKPAMRDAGRGASLAQTMGGLLRPRGKLP